MLENNFDKSLYSFVTAEQLEIANLQAHQTHEHIFDTLVALNFLTETQLAGLIKQTTGLDWVDLDQVEIPSSLWADFNINDCLNLGYVPFYRNGIELRIAIYDVNDLPKTDELKRQFSNYHTTFYFANQRKILDVLHKYRNDDAAGFSKEALTFLDDLFSEAIRVEASDIHFQPYGYSVQVRFRIDGVMHHRKTISSELWSMVLMRLKVLTGLDISEMRKPLSGSFQQKVMARIVDFRASMHPTVHGQSAVLRILDKAQQILNLENLGFSKNMLTQLLNVSQQPYGLFLIGGPTGSGKTTTLYSLFDQMDMSKLNIMTLEDPVEYDLPGIRQTEVREGILNFEEGVRSILRQDPDVIFIGEIRDQPTAHMAIRASMTGHLVFATVHANDCNTIPQRLLDFGIDQNILNSQLLGVMAQRLVRKVCKHCHGESCDKCYDGYRGRTVIAEIMTYDKNNNLCLSAAKDHVQEKLHQNIIDLKEILRVFGHDFEISTT